MVIDSQNSTALAGGFGRIGEYTKEAGAAFVRRLGPASGSRVLDVGCGLGYSASEATRFGATVIGIDADAEMIDRARAAAELEGIDIEFARADAQDLPYADAAFDIVISVFGAMFASRPDRAASEMHRVCRPGGLIAMANWTPDGLIGQMFRIASRYVRPVGFWPFEWGRAALARQCFGDAVESIEFSREAVALSFPFPVSGVVDFWLTYCGPLRDIATRLDADRRTDLRLDLEWLWSGHNASADDLYTIVEAEYLEVRAKKRSVIEVFECGNDLPYSGDLSRSHPSLPV